MRNEFLDCRVHIGRFSSLLTRTSSRIKPFLAVSVCVQAPFWPIQRTAPLGLIWPAFGHCLPPRIPMMYPFWPIVELGKHYWLLLLGIQPIRPKMYSIGFLGNIHKISNNHTTTTTTTTTIHPTLHWTYACAIPKQVKPFWNQSTRQFLLPLGHRRGPCCTKTMDQGLGCFVMHRSSRRKLLPCARHCETIHPFPFWIISTIHLNGVIVMTIKRYPSFRRACTCWVFPTVLCRPTSRRFPLCNPEGGMVSHKFCAALPCPRTWQKKDFGQAKTNRPEQ